MFKKFVSTNRALMSAGENTNEDSGLRGLRVAYSEWRSEKDIGAITAALNRLSTRRLQMIGLRRERLRDTVRDMMVGAEEDRAVVKELIAIIDASADNTLGRHNVTPLLGPPKTDPNSH